MVHCRFPGPGRLATAIAAVLAAGSSADAAVIAVSASCPLASAITTANTDTPVVGCDPTGSGTDTIELGDSVVIDSELPAIVSDIDFVGTGTLPSAINGDGYHRLLRIGDDTHAPTVTFTHLAFNVGIAHGGNASAGSTDGGGAGAGAGLGGALFIYDGTVSISTSSFSNNSAVGGSSSGYVALGRGSAGGGGMFGTGGYGSGDFSDGANGTGGGFGGGGGGGGASYPSEGGGTNGGAGGGDFVGGSAGNVYGSPPGDGGFGGGGGGGGASKDSNTPGQTGAAGGFGGGGGGGGGAGGLYNDPQAGSGGNGGFGAGGGAGGSSDFEGGGGDGGNGGFGGGAGAGGYGYFGGSSGAPGFGGGGVFEGGGGGGAAFGGAIFIRAGRLDLVDNAFDSNASTAGTSNGYAPATAKGGVVFALSSLHNDNGNDAGMPAQLPKVTGCANTFSASAAADAGTLDFDNESTFGASRLALTSSCDTIFVSRFD